MRTPISIKDAKDLGMPNFELYSNNRMCLHRIAMQQADQVISVGNNLTQRALEDLELRNLLLSKVVTIQNGANLDQFDVTNKNTFKSNALKKTFDSNGIETTDYISYRKNLKERLYRQKLIASPTAPIVVFVGRFNPEKGIDILVETVKKSRDLDVQFVFIGWAGENYPPLLELKKMAEGSDKDRLRIFATKEEQKTPFEEIQTIQALRSAADLSLIPSHAEAIGLSAMEALVGTLLIAPEHQGFLDLCKSIDQFDLNTANSVCYKDHTNADQATEALKKGLQVWSNLSPQEKNQLIIRLRNTALKTFNWFYHPSDNEKPIGQFLLYSKMFQELVNKQKIDHYAPDIEKYFNKMKETQITKTDQFINNNFNLKELSMSELIKLHELVSGENLAFYLFNIENQIFRNILLNPNELKDYLSLIKSPSLKIKIDQLKEKISEPSFLEIKELPLPINNSDRPTKILTVALEKTAHCESKSEKDFYLLPLFAKDKQQNITLKIHGIISHQYNGIEVQSTIYKNKETSEYLIEPDPIFSNLFNIPLNRNAYDTTNHYDLYDRISYLGSATAAFIATYQGKKKNKRIDVIKSEEALIGGISFPLLKDKYRATFVKKITQWHPEVDLGTKILVSRNRLINLGFNHQNLRSPAYDILGISTDAADEVIYPNEQMREEAKTHPNHRPDFDAPD